jgi:hypothetical protein
MASSVQYYVREAPMTTSTVIILVLVIAVIALVAAMLLQRSKTRKLRSKFGPEYDRVVDREGNTRRAEAVLDSRKKRVDNFEIRRLSKEECHRFAEQWRVVQERFVDDPRQSVAEADQLINTALEARGYPMADFEQRAADISVEHPRVVEDYRIAHDVAMRDRRGQTSTEDLRRAMQHYRNLFEHVLDTKIVTKTIQYEDIHQ